ncbi:hypothetical protein [uncultured Roseobacter sp.]|uniref:hypothetical protein n=1 Tax=uncultured Roseobacter sp. TaxID=114847 RepID=UPI002628A9CA|nr:hypothetical protein [uncultured Roseobacter sp.]
MFHRDYIFANAVSTAQNSHLAHHVIAAFEAKGAHFQCVRDTDVFGTDDRFRHFQYDGVIRVAKAGAAHKALMEFHNAREAAARLDGLHLGGWQLCVCVPEVVPLADGRLALTAPDLGPTLHQAGKDAVTTDLAQLMIELITTLRKTGVEWKGFAPRNLILDSAYKKLHLIDLEDTFFHDEPCATVRRCIRLKWRLNWLQRFPSGGPLDHSIASIPIPATTSPTDIDNFERCFVRLADGCRDLNTLLGLSDDVTIVAESPLANRPDGEMTPMDVGHFLDEHLPQPVSVFVTFAMARLRRENADDFIRLNADLSARIKSFGKGFGRTEQRALLLCILNGLTRDHSRKFSKCHAEYAALSSATGWQAAMDRSASMDRLLIQLEAAIGFALPFLPQADLLLRGSAGQSVMSQQSDVDFEFSSVDHPEGYPGREALLCDMLDLLDVPAEGSQARPTERDLTGPTGHSRDANEWSQLRMPDGGGSRPPWLLKVLPEATSWWECLSLYEGLTPPAEKQTASYLFKAARSTLARAAARYGGTDARAQEQLAQVPGPLASRLRHLLERALYLREGGQEAVCSDDHLARDITQLCNEIGLPDPFGPPPAIDADD